MTLTFKQLHYCSYSNHGQKLNHGTENSNTITSLPYTVSYSSLGNLIQSKPCSKENYTLITAFSHWDIFGSIQLVGKLSYLVCYGQELLLAGLWHQTIKVKTSYQVKKDWRSRDKQNIAFMIMLNINLWPPEILRSQTGSWLMSVVECNSKLNTIYSQDYHYIDYQKSNHWLNNSLKNMVMNIKLSHFGRFKLEIIKQWNILLVFLLACERDNRCKHSVIITTYMKFINN